MRDCSSKMDEEVALRLLGTTAKWHMHSLQPRGNADHMCMCAKHSHQHMCTLTCAHIPSHTPLAFSHTRTHNLFLVFPISGIYFWSGLPHKWNLLLKTSRETTSRKDSSLISSLCWYDVSMSTLYYLQFLSYPFCCDSNYSQHSV